MNNYQDWAELVAKKLEHESMLLTAIDKEELDDAAASEAFVRAVLKPFLPENYGIGSGRVVDAYGNYSDYLDVIVFNHNYPRIGMRGTHSAYLYESVLAAFSIRAKFIRKTFAEALNACASLADLKSNADKKALRALAAKNGLKAGPNDTFVHQDPLRTARFELIGRPLSFVFGFSGFKFSHRQLQENIELWIDNRNSSGTSTPMKCLPAVIATQGCFAWRNAAPLALSNREMLGIGNDDAPVRLIVLQLLYVLNRRLQVALDGYGLKPNLDAYLSHFSLPRFEVGVGNVAEVIKLKQDQGGSGSAAAPSTRTTAKSKPAAETGKSAPQTAKPAPAQARTDAAAAPKPAAAAEKKAEQPISKTAAAVAAKAAAASKPAAPAAKPAQTAAPKPAEQKPAAASQAAPRAKPAQSESAGVFDKPSPFASAPRPQPGTTEAKTPPQPRAMPRAPLGSAPIPQGAASDSAPMPLPDITLDGDILQEATKDFVNTEITSPPGGETPARPATASRDSGKQDDAQPDFESTMIITPDAGLMAKEKSPAAGDAGKQDDGESNFESTMVMAPDAAHSVREKTKKSGDEFIARVKEQMSSPEPIGEDEKA